MFARIVTMLLLLFGGIVVASVMIWIIAVHLQTSQDIRDWQRIDMQSELP